MKELYMTEKQKRAIQKLFRMGKTYHALAAESSVEEPPDKFEDLGWQQAQQIINCHQGLLRLYK